MTSENLTNTLSPRAMANREKIYDAAVRLIQRYGLEATTVDDIAAEAGMARSSVFNHFSSKTAFLEEFFQRFTSEVIGAASQAQLTGFRNRLQALFAAIGPIAHSNKAMVREIAGLAMGGGPLNYAEREADETMRCFFREIVADAIISGEIRNDVDAEFLTDFLLGILTVTANDWVNRGQKTSLQADLCARFDLLLDGIRKKSKGQPRTH